MERARLIRVGITVGVIVLIAAGLFLALRGSRPAANGAAESSAPLPPGAPGTAPPPHLSSQGPGRNRGGAAVAPTGGETSRSVAGQGAGGPGPQASTSELPP